jgi:Asp-tRNA(Asn)/Glu-tRNA(Gln) amidotransferase A subunit family amidase
MCARQSTTEIDMTITEMKQQIEAKITQANELVQQVIKGIAAADAEDQIEILSNEAEVISDQLFAALHA